MAILNIGNDWGMLTFNNLRNNILQIEAYDTDNQLIPLYITKEQAVQIINHLQEQFGI